MNGLQLKQEGIQQTSFHHPMALDNALMHIELFRKGHLRGKFWDKCFTGEQLINMIRQWCAYPVPHSLHGAIIHNAKKNGLIELTGKYVKADRDSRHCNVVPEYTFALY